MQRVTVANPSDGGLFYWLLEAVRVRGVAAMATLAFVGLGVYLHFCKELPPTARSVDLRLDGAGDDDPVGPGRHAARRAVDGAARDRAARSRAAAARRRLLSTEDRRFFSHGGFDLRGLVRALAANVRAGGVKQGGSTITQQVAKAFLSSERTWSRKIKELIFARRLEAKYSKREILALYLNHIFLGNGAYGVQAAARATSTRTWPSSTSASRR